MKKALILFILALFFMSGRAADTQTDSVLASVNGEPITLLDVIFESGRDESRISAMYSGKELYAETEKLRRKIVNDIIARKLIYEDYDPKKFDIPAQYIEETLDGLASDMSDGTRVGLEKKAKKFGTSIAELREKAKIKIVMEAMIAQICYREVNITPKEIYDYYNNHKEEFSQLPQIDIQMIFLRSDGKNKENIQQIVSQLSSDLAKADANAFGGIAKIYSDGMNADEGGNLGWMDEGKLRPEFAAVLKGADAGSVKGPVKTDEGFYFLRVNARKGAEAASLKSVEHTIKEKIEKEERVKAYNQYVDKLKEKAIIRYHF